MGWTKQQLIDAAYNELAMAGHVFDITPEEYQSAGRSLEAMMAALPRQLAYAFGGDAGAVNLDADSGLTLEDVEAVYLRLATRIAGSKGKTLPRSTITGASQAYRAMLSRLARRQVMEQQLPVMPAGAGHKPIDTTFTPTPDTSPLQIGGDGGLEFLGD